MRVLKKNRARWILYLSDLLNWVQPYINYEEELMDEEEGEREGSMSSEHQIQLGNRKEIVIYVENKWIFDPDTSSTLTLS